MEAWNRVAVPFQRTDRLRRQPDPRRSARVAAPAGGRNRVPAARRRRAGAGAGPVRGQRPAFDHLWVMGLHDGVWPPAAGPDPFIPLALQRERGMPHSDPERERAWAGRVTEQLGAAAPEVIFSFPGRDGAEELACSPLIAGLEAVEPAAHAPRPGDGWAARIRRSAVLEPLPAHAAVAVAPAAGIRRQPRVRQPGRLPVPRFCRASPGRPSAGSPAGRAGADAQRHADAPGTGVAVARTADTAGVAGARTRRELRELVQRCSAEALAVQRGRTRPRWPSAMRTSRPGACRTRSWPGSTLSGSAARSG